MTDPTTRENPTITFIDGPEQGRTIRCPDRLQTLDVNGQDDEGEYYSVLYKRVDSTTFKVA
jgi:hypothetical protein